MDEMRDTQRLLVGHGALVLLFAFVIGFGFLFFLIGKVSLWPIPWELDYQLPGTYDAWRMAHMEGITNGFGLWLMAAVLPLLNLPVKTSRRIAWGMIVVAWTIVIASCMDPLFPDARGLEFHAGSTLASDIAFFLFAIGIGLVIAIMARVAYQCLFVPRR